MPINQLPPTPNVGQEVPNSLWKWLIEMGNRIRALIDWANSYVAPSGVEAHASTHAIGGSDELTPAAIGAEPFLGNPAADNCILSSKADGTRSWIQQIPAPNHYQRDSRWAQKSGVRTVLVTPDYLSLVVNGNLYVQTAAAELDLTAAATWDNSAFAAAANRAGKDFYVYAVEAAQTTPKLILSNNSTVPTGYTAQTSRKIAGFHCLCANVGVISGHSLTGYLAGDILPASVWDLHHRPVSDPEGMVYDANTDRWVDIYLASVQSGKLASVFNAATADGASSPTAFHWYNGTDWMTKVKKNLLTQRQFVSASLGSNQGTNIAGSADPNTTGGHSDTAGRRMISNIGCEDMCGALWQWGCEGGGPYSSAAWANAFDGNDTGVGGQHYNAPDRALLGGNWIDGAACGSRGSRWNSGPLSLYAYCGLRGCAEPLRGAF